MKHTQGNWKVVAQVPDGYSIETNDGKVIAMVQSDGIDTQSAQKEESCNARLIAAAPKLLEALIQAQKLIEIARPYMPKTMRNADKFDFENISANDINKAIAIATTPTKIFLP